jgi:Tfp pilus assembly protein PilV
MELGILSRSFVMSFYGKTGRRGFTFLELMIVCAILIVALTGLLATYVTCLELTETTKNSNFALHAAQKTLEELRSTAFTSIASTYNGYVFQVPFMATNASIGRVVVDSSNATLLQVDVGVCWRQKGNRIIGACHDVLGVLTANNATGPLDSPVRLVTLVGQR